MDPKEMKTAIDTIGASFEEFKKTNDLRLKEIAEKGAPLAETEAKLAKIDKDLGEALAIKERLDRMETAFKRGGVSEGNKSLEQAELDTKYEAARHLYLRKADPSALEALAAEHKDLTVQDDTEGGYFVVADRSGRTVGQVFESSPLRSLASVQTISTDALEGIYDDDEAGAEWVGETDSPTDTTTPSVGKYRIPADEMATRPKATQKLLEDAEVNPETWLLGKVQRKFGRFEATAFVTGNGVAKPRGFLSYAASATADVYERGTIGQVGSGAVGAFSADGIVDMLYTLKAEHRAMATWACSRTSFAAIRKLKDGEDQYLWAPGLQAGQPTTLLGLPTAEFNDMPDVANNALALALANWEEAYQIVDRVGMSVLRDPYTAKPYVEFYVRKRVGGAVIGFDAIKIMKINAA